MSVVAPSPLADETRQAPAALVVTSPNYLDSLYGAAGVQAIAERTRLLAPPLAPEDIRRRPELLADVEVLFSGWTSPVLDRDFLQQAPRLRAVFYAGGSVRYFVTDDVWQRGITVCSAYALNGEAVADYTVGATLFSLKQGFAHATAARRGAFATLPVLGVYRATVGLISLGASGLAVARKLALFGVRVIAYDPHFPPAEAAARGIELRGKLEEIFSEAEVVSLHTPLLPATTGLVTGAHFRQLQPGATFINTARGAVVREKEMIAVLQERPDLTAILDVTDPEPPATGSPLYSLPNVLLTPHVAGALPRECRRLGEAMIQEFDRWQRQEPLQHAIQPAQLTHMA